ncbi:unnamed protein product [Trifolium pratense]|uniref:Uncharacterized protein n=1 Tax=Trifolium pratense TaxID=57577 RepID=A0ACB0KWM6_TRIPR|nr:unnamed protein product [Trifolium pratense]
MPRNLATVQGVVLIAHNLLCYKVDKYEYMVSYLLDDFPFKHSQFLYFCSLEGDFLYARSL